MDDAELTRLAIAEIVREMGELKDPPLQERKINPIAKPNKRFLGRTLNSVLSHNKRENDRTQENCRKKLRELDERHERKYSRDRSSSGDLVLSSSADEDHRRDSKKRRKKRKKTTSRKHKKDRKVKNKSRKRKSNRRDSSRSSSSESSSSCSTSGSSSRSRSRSSRSRKSSRHKTPIQADMNATEEQTYYEQNMNAALELDAALMADSYRQHQIQQLMFYSALIAGNEAAEINALQEELQISDIDFTEPQLDKKSISSAASSLNSEDGESGGSEILQISLSSASSTSSKVSGRNSLRRKRAKKKESLKRIESPSSANEAILELDSDSSVASVSLKEGKLAKTDDCICIDSETENDTDTDTAEQSGSNSTNSETESQRENITNDIGHAAVETVTLLSSSDSEVEIVTNNDAKAIVQEKPDADVPVISTCQMEITEEEMAKETSNLSKSQKEILAIESLTGPLLCSTTICSVESTQASMATVKSNLSLSETKEISNLLIQSPPVRISTKGESASEDINVDTFEPDSQSDSPIICTEKAHLSNAVVIELIAPEETTDTSNSSHVSTSFLNKNDLISMPESCTLVSLMVRTSKSESPPLSLNDNKTETPPSFSVSTQSDPSHNSCLEVLKSPLPTLAPSTPIVSESDSVNRQNENTSSLTTFESNSEHKSSLDNSPVLCHQNNN